MCMIKHHLRYECIPRSVLRNVVWDRKAVALALWQVLPLPTARAPECCEAIDLMLRSTVKTQDSTDARVCRGFLLTEGVGWCLELVRACPPPAACKSLVF